MQLLLSAICMALTSAVIGNAWYQKKQFYPAVVYITKSNASMAVIYIQFFAIVFMFGKLLRKIFLGTLRAAEFEHLLERFWYALTETCLAFTVFRDDFNPRFVALFTVLLFLKSFHWLAEERVDFMERSPVLGWLFHIRVASLLLVLGFLDYMLLMDAYHLTLARGPTVQLVFGFEYAILLTVVASTAIKYVLHAAEMRTDTPWENKAVFLLYTELFIGLIKVVLYILFVVIMAKFYALPMFVFRPMFFTIKNFKKALNDVIMSRRAIRNMNTLYPDATPEELRLSDNICIICREDMVNHSKKLPCGHIFHTTCLRSWFQRQQTCPTCRLNILRAPAANSTAIRRLENNNANNAGAAAPNGAAAVPAAANTATPGAANNVNANANAGTGENVAGAVPAANGFTFEELVANIMSNRVANGPGAAGPAGFPGFAGAPLMPPPPPPPFMMPTPFSFVTPYAVPPPPMPSDLTRFTDSELQLLEGYERRNVEARITLLRNIQSLLDAANVLMNNYQIASVRTQASGPPPTLAGTSPSNGSAGDEQTAPSSKDIATDKKSSTNASAEEMPSTSTAAAASAASLLQAQAASAVAASAANDPVAKQNEVTIEDLGQEDHIDPVVSMATATAAANIDASTLADSTTTEHINELRKRRLKFLEERNKTSTE